MSLNSGTNSKSSGFNGYLPWWREFGPGMVIIEDCSNRFHSFHHFYNINPETSIKNKG
jgi:hypothetical protein